MVNGVKTERGSMVQFGRYRAMDSNTIRHEDRDSLASFIEFASFPCLSQR